MRFLRIVLGYVLASLGATLTLLAVQAETMFDGDWGVELQTFEGLLEMAGALAFFMSVIGGIMLIPALIFLTVAWGKRGPSLLGCLLFGGLGGFLIFVFFLSLDGVSAGGSSEALGFAATFGLAGLVAALVFWFVAVWPRPAVLPEP